MIDRHLSISPEPELALFEVAADVLDHMTAPDGTSEQERLRTAAAFAFHVLRSAGHDLPLERVEKAVQELVALEDSPTLTRSAARSLAVGSRPPVHAWSKGASDE